MQIGGGYVTPDVQRPRPRDYWLQVLDVVLLLLGFVLSYFDRFILSLLITPISATDDTSLEALGNLKPVFDRAHGSVTAGNSSPLTDGAAALLVMREDRARALGLKPLARFVSFAVAGVDPDIMGVGPIKAVPKVLKQAGVAQDDLDWIELNEAFAAQSLAVIKDLGLNPEKVNPQGGAIALGHPLGATGAIRTATLMSGLRRNKSRYGMVTMCIGTGMGAAGLFEAIY